MATKIQIINKSKNPLPEFATSASAGMDLRADLQSEMQIAPMERKLIKTGLFMALPKGYEAQLRPRSGLALKEGITVLNTPGTIDADYRGEIGVILINLSENTRTIAPGQRVAQMVIAKCEQPAIELVDDLKQTQRGSGGFGSTGK